MKNQGKSKLYYLFHFLFILFITSCSGADKGQIIEPGAYQIEQYIESLYNKKVGVVANHTSFINNVHLIDTLLALKIDVRKIF